MKILAIDDNRDNLVAVRAVIREALPQAEVFTATSGPEGIELARAEDPDVILLDIVMPGIDGFEVCRRLKADDGLSDTPVVFLTATRTDAAARVRALEVGAEAFLAKPLEPVELIAQIGAMVKVKAAARLRRTEKERLEALVADRTRDLEHHLGEVRRLADEWQHTFDSVKDVVWILDEQMRVVRSNHAAELVFGRGIEQIVGRHCWEIVHGGSGPTTHCPLVRMHDTRLRESADLPSDGRWVEVTVDPIVDAAGNITGSVHIISDITERKLVEAAVELQARRSSILLELPAAAEELSETEFLQWGFERAQRLVDSTTGFVSYCDGKNPASVGPEWQTAYAEASEHLKPVVHNDTPGRSLCVPVFEGGKAALLVCVGGKPADYTELDVESLQLVANEIWRIILHRRAEVALAHSEESYRTLTEQLPVIIYRAAADGSSTTTFISQAVRMLGYTPAEWLANPTLWIDNLHPEDGPRVLAALGALHQGRSFAEEYRLRDRAGNWRHFRDEAIIIDDPRDGAQYVQGVMVDITEHRRAQARTRQALDLAMRRRREFEGLLGASRAIQEHADFTEAGRRIFAIAKDLLGASCGFVALRSETGDESLPVLFDLGSECVTSGPISPMPTIGPLLEAYASGRAVLDNSIGPLSRILLPNGHIALENLLIIPLSLDGGTLGLLGLANKAGGFADEDLALAAAFADLAALALKNARQTELRERAEESLRLSERRYRDLFDNPFTGVVVYEAIDEGSDFLVREFNEAAERMTDRVKKNVLGKPVSEVFPGVKDMGLFDVMRRVYETGEAIHYLPSPYSGFDGVTRWYENHVHRLPSGEVVALFEDVTVQHAAEIELRDSRERYALLFDTSNDAIFVHEMDGPNPGRFTEVNEVACVRLGYTRDELLRMSPEHIDAAETDDLRRQAMERLAAHGDVVFETVQLTKHGDRLPVEISSRLFSYRGETYSLSIVRDIAERKQAESAREALQAQLLQAQKMESVGRLAGGVAHDFNNLLSIILGYGESIFESLHPADPLREQAKQVVDAANRSADLTRQLLAFSRKQTLQPEVLDLNDVVLGLEKMLRRLIGEHIELELSLDESIGRVLVDPGQMEQVMMNLVVNARDAMPKGGKLRLETREREFDRLFAASHPGTAEGRHVVLTVADTGCGMSQALINRIFEPFFTTKEMGEGTGLGLSTVYGIVKQSGGSIWVESTPSEGTTFEVCLPLTEIEGEPRRTRGDEERRTKGGEHVLIVEDEEGLRKLMEALLPRLGYEVTTAANGGEGLLLVEEKGLQPDLIITDVVMPTMSGKEFVNRLRRSHPELKVLYMSGYTDDAIAQHGVLEPGTPFLQKPFTINELAAKIRGVLDER